MQPCVVTPETGQVEARLDALRAYDILDTPAEPGFDDAVQLAREICGTPIALVSLLDRDRQWFKARVGLEASETPLDQSVCAHALRQTGLFVIPDLTLDPRTRDNPLVTGPLGLRFYAGARLEAPGGVAIGTLCVIDTVPRPSGLTPSQAAALEALARQVMVLLETRRLNARLASRERYWREVFERLHEAFVVGEIVRDAEGRAVDCRVLEANHAWAGLFDASREATVGRTVRDIFPGLDEAWIEDFARVVQTGEATTFSRPIVTPRRWYEGRVFRLAPDRIGLLLLDITKTRAADFRRAATQELGDRLRDLRDVGEMTREAAGIMARTLGATRAGYGAVDTVAETVVLEPDWCATGTASLAGLHRFRDYGSFIDDLLRGEVVVVRDVTSDPRTAEFADALLAIGIRVLVNVPIVEHGRLTAVFFVHCDEPRVWSQEEIAFVRNVADRTRAAIARVRAEEHQRVLNQELSHRLKNSLAMVQAIANQTLRRAADREAVEAFEQRLHALSTAHDVLLQESWASARIRTIVAGVFADLGQSERCDLRGPDVEFGPRATLSTALLLHELATNAIKYGALSAPSGRVAVEWDIEGGGEPTFTLRWRERGGPTVGEPTGKGFGSRLIRMGLVGTGGVDIRYPASGFEADMGAPLSQVRHS